MTDSIISGDPVQIFSGVCDAASFDPYSGAVSITLALAGSGTQFTPRTRIIPRNGFNWCPASGTVINWNGEVYELTAGEGG